MKKGILNQKDLASMAEELFHKISFIKNKYPQLAREIDKRESLIRAQVAEIARQVNSFPQEEERNLVKILVAHGIQKILEEHLAD
ncbi:MAG: hypothetical protein HY606_11285 [Planctomycetes bacterium]|nr:hypothetical protein [Planctomycetota bacterium]